MNVLSYRNLCMDLEDHRTTTLPIQDPEAEVVAFLRSRSVPCPRCGYDLRDIQSARCPECAEPLVLKIGSPRAHFGWLLLAMAPGCFSGVAAVFVLVPIFIGIWHNLPPGDRMPWPGVAADVFGFLSATTVVLMYRHRHRIMSWRVRRQVAFAATIWAIHIAALALLIVGMWYATTP
jgi:hypothetical protein